MLFSVVFASHHPCSCRASLPLPKFSAPCFSPLDFSSLWLTLNLQLSTFNRIFFCPSSPHLCALCVLCGENSLLFRSSLIPRHSPLTTNSFTIRTYETPLPQPLYNPHLQAPLGSAGNKGLITPLESALTRNSPVSRLESALTKRWGVGGAYPANAEFLFGGTEGEEVLGALDGFLKATEEKLEVVAALDEVNVRRVDDQEVRGRVAKEEVFVGARNFLDVFEGDASFVAGSLLGDAGAEDFGLGLEIDDEIGSGKVRGEGFVITLVELELFVGEVEIGEDAVLLQEEIGEERAGSFDGEGFAEALLALDEEVHLGAEGGAGFCIVEIGEEGIVLAIIDAAGVEALREDPGEGGFADAQRAFNDDETGKLRAALRNASALRGGGAVAGHRWMSPRRNRVSAAIIADSRTESSPRVPTLEAGKGRAKKVQMFSLLWPIYGLVLPVENGQTEGLQECTN